MAENEHSKKRSDETRRVIESEQRRGRRPIDFDERERQQARRAEMLQAIRERRWADVKAALLVLRPRDYVTKLVSGPLACELPLYGNPVAIHTTIPGPSLLAQASDVSDSAFA